MIERANRPYVLCSYEYFVALSRFLLLCVCLTNVSQWLILQSKSPSGRHIATIVAAVVIMQQSQPQQNIADRDTASLQCFPFSFPPKRQCNEWIIQILSAIIQYMVWQLCIPHAHLLRQMLSKQLCSKLDYQMFLKLLIKNLYFLFYRILHPPTCNHSSIASM